MDNITHNDRILELSEIFLKRLKENFSLWDDSGDAIETLSIVVRDASRIEPCIARLVSEAKKRMAVHVTGEIAPDKRPGQFEISLKIYRPKLP